MKHASIPTAMISAVLALALTTPAFAEELTAGTQDIPADAGAAQVAEQEAQTEQARLLEEQARKKAELLAKWKAKAKTRYKTCKKLYVKIQKASVYLKLSDAQKSYGKLCKHVKYLKKLAKKDKSLKKWYKKAYVLKKECKSVIKTIKKDLATQRSNAASLKYNGEVYSGGWRYTWYSQNVLPGGGLKIPGRHVGNGGLIMDKWNNVVVASEDLSKGTELDTPYGRAKVYDSGCPDGTIDVYTNW